MLLGVFLLSCSSIQVKQIGQVNMISTRNINPSFNYQVIKTYAGNAKELKESKALTIDDAINQTVKKVPGGEFLMNVKIYRLKDDKETFYAIEGDVWGTASNQSIKGIKASDRVRVKKSGKYLSGIVVSLKDDQTCIVKIEEVGKSDKTVEVSYDEISKE